MAADKTRRDLRERAPWMKGGGVESSGGEQEIHGAEEWVWWLDRYSDFQESNIFCFGVRMARCGDALMRRVASAEARSRFDFRPERPDHLTEKDLSSAW